MLYELELKAYNVPTLLELGLIVAKMDGDGAARGIRSKRQKPALSLPDAFALALAAAQIDAVAVQPVAPRVTMPVREPQEQPLDLDAAAFPQKPGYPLAT